ncbi:MAG: hypothetical protein D6734_05660 [Candidatus Schekmanbacteria bacterium]|nr:MAG: hypothetical protein D6734_05660 [Candidatus Schekmanbacteria bacterium]
MKDGKMVKKSLCFIVFTLIVVSPFILFAQTPPHDSSNNVTCLDCHSIHNASAGNLVAHGAEQETLCKTCHNPTGPASSMPDVANHVVNGGTTIVECSTCHNPHETEQSTNAHTGQTADNLKLIRSDVTEDISAAVTPVVFQTDPDDFAFATAPYNGVCQACHTQTDHHRNDGSAPAQNHNIGADCTSCHTHDSGFMPMGGGDCTACHSSEQGSIPRRQVTGTGGDFERTSHHEQGVIVASECGVCHAEADDVGLYHASGAVDVKEPDSGTVITFNPSNPSALEPFCLGCHDSDGANGVLAPFSDTITAPNIAATWTGSAHQTSGFLTCFGDGTTGCHQNAHGSEKENILAPDTPAATPPLYAEEQEGFCLNCHDADGPSSINIAAEISKTNRHPAPDYGDRHSKTEGGDPTKYAASPIDNRHAECVDCHNPHAAQSSSPLAGVGRIKVTNNGAGNIPTYTYVSASDSSAPFAEYQICFKCHSSWTTQPAGQVDLAVKLNSDNPSYHPVEAQGTNTNINANAFVNGWSATDTMNCSDCHGSDNSAVSGPHGSNYNFILKASYQQSSSKRTMSPNEICFQCHRYDTYANNNASQTVKSYSRFNPPKWSKGHTFHVGKKQYPCYACHDSHGSANKPHLIVTGRNPGLNNYQESQNGGTCWPKCHGQKTYSINYAR